MNLKNTIFCVINNMHSKKSITVKYMEFLVNKFNQISWIVEIKYNSFLKYFENVERSRKMLPVKSGAQVGSDEGGGGRMWGLPCSFSKIKKSILIAQLKIH